MRRCTRSLRSIVLASALLAAPIHAQSSATGETSLPDWSGVWQMMGRTIFDPSTVDPPDGASGAPGVREYPPFNDEWEEKYLANIDRVARDVFPDPQTYCGYPAGFPRVLNLPGAYEFIVTPEQVWILTEYGPNIVRIYTDRGHLAPEDLWPTYNGDSVGHWEGDTLVFDTISLKGGGDGDTIIDRTGIVLSDQMHIGTRMRKIDADTIEAQFVVEDSKALTAPWHTTKRFMRLPPDAQIYDFACAENNRNPVSESGKTLTLGPDGEPIDVVR